MGCSPRLTTISFDDCTSLVMTLDGDCLEKIQQCQDSQAICDACKHWYRLLILVLYCIHKNKYDFSKDRKVILAKAT